MAATERDIASVPNIGVDANGEEVYSKKESVSDAAYKEKDVESGASVSEDSEDSGQVLSDARDLVTHVISVEDDPTLPYWTFRVLVLGLGLSAFGGVLGQLILVSPK